MSGASRPVALEELLAHRAWVRDLARGLARDEHEAADAEQATWVAALRSPPSHRTSLRGWLAVTTRNAVAKLRRSERRRLARETAAPHREDVVDAADLAARAESHRCVVEALLRLPEPHRAALLLRYFQGLPVAESAARLGVSERTCRDRIRAGLALLRDDLEPRFGGREAFGVALLALQDTGRSGGAAAAGGVVVGTVTKTAAAVAAALLLAGLAWRVAGDGAGAVAPTAVDGSAASVTTPADRGPSSRPVPVDRPGTARARRPAEALRDDGPTVRAAASDAPAQVAPSPPEPAAEPAPPADAETRLRRTAVGAEWRDSTIRRGLAEISQLADVPVWAPREIAEGGGTRVTFSVEGMQAGGVLGIFAQMGNLEVRVEADRAVLFRPGVADGDLVLVPRLDALPREVATIVVTDDAGNPVPGAAVRRLLGGGVVATTGPDGRAEIRDVPPLPRVFARIEGREDSGNAEPPPGGDTVLRLGGPSARLTVRVRDRLGHPAPGAAVRVVPDTTGFGPRYADERFLTADDGSYVHASCPARDVRVTVTLAGHATESRVVSARAAEDVSAAFDLVEEAVVEGVVRNADGSPAPQITVNVMRGRDRAGRCVTDGEGRFRIPGLAAGAVTVGAKRTFSEFASASADLVRGETRRIELTLPPSGSGRR